MPRLVRRTVLSFFWILGFALPTQAGVVVYEEGDKKIEIGARIQIQYLRIDPDGADSQDDFFFRRLRPYVKGTVTENWLGKIQLDFGESEESDELKIKDAYARYLGIANNTITLGNSKAPFSREFLASSKRQQLVERSFTGDHNFGSPARQLGVRWDGQIENKKITYAACIGAQNHDPGVNRMDFGSPVNNQSDWNQGWLGAARIDFHPLGFAKFDQADFHSEALRFNFSLAGFSWSNDEDNNSLTDPLTGLATDPDKVDLDSAVGLGVSAGLRGHGFSADAEYQQISADTVDSEFTGGLYRNGTTDLNIFAIEGGYMIPGISLELVGGWDSFDADNYQSKFERTSIGLNWYWNKHKAKLQTTYRMVKNFLGSKGADQDVVMVQMQFVF